MDDYITWDIGLYHAAGGTQRLKTQEYAVKGQKSRRVGELVLRPFTSLKLQWQQILRKSQQILPWILLRMLKTGETAPAEAGA